jgi:endoglucanase
MAAGGNDINAIDTDPVDSQHILYGAVVGGPAKDDKYFNLRSDYIQSEIALDYTAPLLTLAASSLLLTPDTPPFYTTLAAGAYQVPAGKPCDAAYPCKGKGGGGDGLSSGAIIAIVVVVVVVVLVLALLACWKWLGWFRWR